MIERNVIELAKLEPEEPARRVEGRLDHLIERQIGLDLRLVERELRAPHLLRVVAPVPRLDRDIGGFGARHGLELVAIAACTCSRRLAYFLQQAPDMRR